MSFAMLLAHTLSGENALIIPLYASDLSLGLKALVSALWHGTTLILLVNTLALVWTTFNRTYLKPITLIVGGQYFALACIFFAEGFFQLGSVWIMTQWITGFCIAGLCLLGFKGKRPIEARYKMPL